MIYLMRHGEDDNTRLGGWSNAGLSSDGESPKLFYERISYAWKNFKNDVSKLNGNVLLVTHGGVINIILCCENRVEYTNKYLNYSIENAEITSL